MSDHPHEPTLSADLPSDADWDAIARFLSGESDAAETEAVKGWLAAHPEDAALVHLVKARTARIEARADVTVDTGRALATVRSRLGEDVLPTLRVERGGASRTSPKPAAAAGGAGMRNVRWIGFAAAAGIAAMALTQFRDGAPAAGPAAGAPAEYRTAVGQRDSINLPDGSVVVLAPGSRLTLAAGYGAGARTVTLEGAAYFDVKHDEVHPFTVRAADADIRDIGTAFSVKTAANGAVAVHVTHGIVELRAHSDSTVATDGAGVELRAGDRGVLASRTVTVSRGVVTADDVAWTRGQLSYRDASIAEVQADIMRWYGIDLRVTDSTLVRRTLTASFRGDSASQVIRVIALALGADAVQRGDTVTLQPQASGNTPMP